MKARIITYQQPGVDTRPNTIYPSVNSLMITIQIYGFMDLDTDNSQGSKAWLDEG